jgi:hypothetical protein
MSIAITTLIQSVTFSVFTPSAVMAQPKWPAITQQTKPWTRWWWMGSAVMA